MLLTHSSISWRLRVSVVEAVVKTFTAMATRTQTNCREKGQWWVTGRGYRHIKHYFANWSPSKAQRELPSMTAAGPAKDGGEPEEGDSVPQRSQEGKEAVFSCADYRTAGHATGSTVAQASEQESREMMCLGTRLGE